MIDVFRGLKYFSKLNDSDYQAILRCFRARFIEYKKGSSIVNIGDSSEYLYIIASGTARSQLIDINGKVTIVRDYIANDIFGIDYSMNEIDTYTEELIAIEDTKVAIVNAFRFIHPCENLCKRHINCMINTFSMLSGLMNKQKYRVVSLCQSKTRAKILSFLNEQSKKKNKYFKIPYNQTELSIYLGLERSALSYELNNMKRDGLIDFDGDMYKIITKKNKAWIFKLYSLNVATSAFTTNPLEATNLRLAISSP